MKEISVQINQREVLKYLGYKGGQVDEKLLQDVDKMSQTVIDCVKPRITYQIFKIDWKKGLSLQGTKFVPEGTQVKQLLEDSTECVLFAATLGMAIDHKIAALQLTDLYAALLMDCCASSAIEGVCDDFCKQMQETETVRGRYLTDRFSPGYGDLPFSQQKDVCQVLQTEKRIGVNLNGAGIMIPKKSVTALFGLSDHVQRRRFRGCEHCSMFENCDYRRGGTTCGDTEDSKQ